MSTPPRAHVKRTGPSWSLCYTRGRLGATTRETQKGGGRREENLERGKLISVRLPPLVPSRPPCAPVIITGYLRSHQETQRTQSQSPEMPQERHLHHRRTILSKEACEQTSRESCSAAETTNQPFNTSTGAGLAMTAIDGLSGRSGRLRVR